MRRLTYTLLLATLCLPAAGCFRAPPSQEKQDRQKQLLRSGTEAFDAGDFEQAVRLFDEGLKLNPDEPNFYTNKSMALRSRAVLRFNASFRLKGDALRAAERDAARPDLVEACELADEAVGRIKSISALDAAWSIDSYRKARRAAFAARADALFLLASKFDKARADEAVAALHEYADEETDDRKKLKARLYAGQVLLDARRGAQAADEYKKVLADHPDNLDATLGVGLGLFQTGERERYAEAALCLRRFVERAPEDHPLRASAREALDFMSEHGIPPASRPAR